LRVRTYEKGVEAETQACGTGALAAAVVARLLDRVAGRVVPVAMPGGTLRVGLDVANGTVSGLYLEGPAVKVFRGTIDAEPHMLG
jgi:diaminopimelate epimerase